MTTRTREAPLIITLIATAGGAGLLPRAPGTAGSLVGLTLLIAARYAGANDLAIATVIIAIFAVGTWAAGRYDATQGKHDSQQIVIDEVVGQAIASFTALHPLTYALSFLAFRAFDILKPPPVRNLDSWSKNRTGGLGVMLDDVAAGALALAVIFFLQRYGILP